MRKHSYIIFIFFLLLSFSCSKKTGLVINLDETPVLSGNEWAVVNLAYLNLKAEPGSDGRNLQSVIRMGDCFVITGCKRFYEGRDKGDWYCILTESGKGWTHESALKIFSSEYEAKQFAKLNK